MFRYKTEDPINALRLKVVLQVEDPENQEHAWVRKERVFGWQDKVFGPVEFEKYKKLAAEEQQAGASNMEEKRARVELSRVMRDLSPRQEGRLGERSRARQEFRVSSLCCHTLERSAAGQGCSA